MKFDDQSNYSGRNMREVLDERYELQELIGRGGMATIYRALDRRIGRRVAIKVLRDTYSSDVKFVTRFQREAQAASMLTHPNIVQVYDYGQAGDSYYIVMEYVSGVDLRRYMRSAGEMPIDRVVAIAHDVASALGAAHRHGIVHRDVKPQNILIDAEGIVKLTDFGIASLYQDLTAERLTTTGMTLGTVQYYAPEQAQGEMVTPAADVYSLGIVIYEMLCGHPPFDGETPVAVAVRHIQEPPTPPHLINPTVPPALETIVLRCLEKLPEHRYPDGSALAYALEVYEDAGEDNPVLLPPGIGALVDEPSADPYQGGSTRPVGAPPGTVPRTRVPPDNRPRSQVTGVTTLLLFTAALALLGASCFLANQVGLLSIFSARPTATPIAHRATVPGLVGMQLDDARNKAEQAGFKLAVSRHEPDPNGQYPAGAIIAQDPQSGATAARGATIQVVVSSGAAQVTVPNLTGLTLGQAQQALANHGLTLGTVTTQVSDQPSGTVLNQSPAALDTVSQGTAVNVVISQAPAPTATLPPAPTATATPQPAPTATATPQPAPTATATPQPSPSPAPTATATPTATPTPSGTKTRP
jgi:serine/threonine protein kinase